MIDEYTGKKIVSPLDLCCLMVVADAGETYSVTTQSRITPAALFSCFHCASKWRNENLPHAEIMGIPKSLSLAFQQS